MVFRSLPRRLQQCEEDHHYLDDEEMARCIAELGYRSGMAAHSCTG